MLWDPFLMKKLLKSEVCGSRALFTGPMGLIKGAEKSTIYDYYSWTVAVCPSKRMCSSREKRKKKRKKRRNINAKRNSRIQTRTLCLLHKMCFQVQEEDSMSTQGHRRPFGNIVLVMFFVFFGNTCG